MKLPQSEIERIDKNLQIHGGNEEQMKSEASMWLERMEKFAEWVSDNGWKRIFNTDKWQRMKTANKRPVANEYEHATTLELSTEFINGLK